MNKKKSSALTGKALLINLPVNIRTSGILSLATILMFWMFVASCDNEKERQRDGVQVLNSYNHAIEDYHRRAGELWMTFDHAVITGYNMEQTLWDVVREEHNLDSVEMTFLDEHGEDAFNELKLLISDNFDRKMRK